MMTDNICKFISRREAEVLTASNFILETQMPDAGQTCICKEHIVYLTLSGKGNLIQAGVHHTLSAGSIFFTFKDVPFCIENDEKLQYMYISFSGGRSEKLFCRFGISPTQCLWKGMESLFPLWKEALMRANEENIDLLCESILLYTFSKLKKAPRQSKDISTLVTAYLEQHFTEQELTLSGVAAAIGYNEKYLSHAFKKQFGMTFSRYLSLLRIKHAVLLMENGVTSIKNIALLCGFADPLYFSKVFAAQMGVSPKEYLQK